MAGFKGAALKDRLWRQVGSAVGSYSYKVPSATASKFTTPQKGTNQRGVNKVRRPQLFH